MGGDQRLSRDDLPVIDGFDFSGFVTRADVIRRIQVKAELAGLRE